jgi:hypothetical protein
LAVINPCGFPLLPAFLSVYLGANEDELPRAPTRIVQGLLVGRHRSNDSATCTPSASCRPRPISRD